MTNNQLKPDPDISTQKIIFINAKYILLILRHGLFPQSFKGKCAVFVGRMDPRKTLRHLTQAHLISQQPIGSNQFSSFVCNQGCAEKCQYISNNVFNILCRYSTQTSTWKKDIKNFQKRHVCCNVGPF